MLSLPTVQEHSIVYGTKLSIPAPSCYRPGAPARRLEVRCLCTLMQAAISLLSTHARQLRRPLAHGKPQCFQTRRYALLVQSIKCSGTSNTCSEVAVLFIEKAVALPAPHATEDYVPHQVRWTPVLALLELTSQPRVPCPPSQPLPAR